MNTCPTCGKSVDALRARFVSVRDGRVIAFCSAECKAAAETRPIALAAPAPMPAPKPEPKPEPKAEAKPEPKPEPKPDKKAKKVDTRPTPKVEPEVAAAPEAVPAKPKTPDEGSTKLKRPPIADDGKSTPIAGFKLQDFSTYAPEAGERPAAAPEPEPEPEPAPPRGKLGLAIVVLLVLGGAGVLAYKLLAGGRSNAATLDSRAPVAAAIDAAPAIDAPPAITAAAALDRATSTLHGKLGGTPKIALAAAAALARTGDKDALATLAKLLPAQQSDIAKLVIAYQLARGGDEHGRALLVADLGVDSRERRLEAGRWLARLGDARATAALLNYMEYAQFRMNIAVLLAETKDPKALKALDDLVKDPKATDDDRARATIALAVGGRAELQPKVQALLADNRFNTEAALALAKLHDAAARPVLEKQLGVSALRVGAARALRLLDPDLPTSPNAAALLAPLVAELASEKDVEQVVAAEALLLLAGPAAWSERE